ncbi:hypothetical protein ACNEP6_25585, partial [Escherichia coli]
MNRTGKQGWSGTNFPSRWSNIAPLAVKPFRPGKLALVCEGGGRRGEIFTARVLDNLCAPKSLTFDLMLGTSAGARKRL